MHEINRAVSVNHESEEYVKVFQKILDKLRKESKDKKSRKPARYEIYITGRRKESWQGF